MTREEAIAAVLAATPLSAADLDGFLACTDDERAALIQTYVTAGIIPSRSTWDVVLDIFRATAEFASLVMPITGALAGVAGLRHA